MGAMKTLLVVLVVALAGAAALTIHLSRPLFEDRIDEALLAAVPLAPLDEALSFARVRGADGRLRLIAASRYGERALEGVDLGARLGLAHADPLRLYRELGHAAIAAAVAGAEIERFDADALDLPFDARAENIGIGANFREHAREAGVDETPFVFPKIAAPTPCRSSVARGRSHLLDYEAELGLVALDAIDAAAPPPPMGLVLANELTDRFALVRGFDGDAPMGTTGFADGKSRDGFAPIGCLLVIPRALDAFVARLHLQLWVNGGLRQSERAGRMVWGPAGILREIHARRDWRFRHGEAARPLPPLAAGTIVFAGTPAGVVFKPFNFWNPWLYLQPGDEIVVRADFLGLIRNRVLP